MSNTKVTGTVSQVVSIPEVAKILHISRGLAYELARTDRLGVTVIRLGNRRMVVPLRALERLLEGQQVPQERHQ